MSEDKQHYNLITTYLPIKKIKVSTMYRQSSSVYADIWYFETIVFGYDTETSKGADLIHMQDSGGSERIAFVNHQRLVDKVINGESLEEKED